MPLAALIPAAVGLAGGLIKGGTKTGKDTTQTTNFGNSSQYNPSAFQYGGNAAGADDAANRYRMQAEQAQGRAGPQADFQYNQPNYNNAAQWGNLVGADRGGQSQVAGMMLNRATGGVPSIAGQQAHQDIAQLQQNAALQGQQAMAQQASQAASARGAGGMALAQQNAANNLANEQGAIGHGMAQATQNISNQAQVNAANERMQAEQAASGAFGQMRAGDTGMVNDEAQRAQFNANLGTQQQQFNAGLQNDQRARNDAMTLGMTGQEAGVRSTALQGGIAGQRTLAGSSDADQGYHAAQGARNAAWENNNWDATQKAITSGAGAGASVPAMARGGPVGVGTPYLVGEKGPELIVPRYDGTVIPAGPTAALMRGGMHARARGGPVSGVRMLSPQKAGAPAVIGQATAPVLSKGGKGKGGAKPQATMPMPSAPTPIEQTAEAAPAPMAPVDPQTQRMLDDRYVQQTAPTVGAEVLRQPFDASAPPKAAATPGEQARFERKLTGQAPTLEDQNQDEAAKIRASFDADKQQDEATARWEKSFGNASDATAGARGAPAGKAAIPMWQQALLAATGHAREDGGPVEGAAPRQMKTFQREEPYYVDPRMPAVHLNEQQENARRIAAIGGLATAVMSPAAAAIQAAQDLSLDAGALGGRAIENAKETAGNVPSRQPVALAKGGPHQLDTASDWILRKPPTEVGHFTAEETRDALLRGAFGPSMRDEPEEPPAKEPEKKPEPESAQVATTGRATVPRGRKRAAK